MAIIHLLIGIPGCGKSTFAKKIANEKNISIISTDVIRLNNPSLPEEDVWPKVYSEIGDLLNNEKSLIFDATNITPKVRKRLVDNVSVFCEKFQMIAYFFNVDYQLCEKRVALRNDDKNEHYLPVEVIKGYSERIIEPTFDEGFIEIYYLDENGLIVNKMKKKEE